MVKKNKDISTEERIINAAKKIFVKKGFDGAKMQDIADEAKINKAMLHYYYRSKDKLFEKIFSDVFDNLFPRLSEIFSSEDDFFSKINRFCEVYIDQIKEHPYVPMFIFSQLQRDPSFLTKCGSSLAKTSIPEQLMEIIAKEKKKGTIKNISPQHLVVNLLSLTIFPFVAKPFIKLKMKMNDKEFSNFLDERKKHIPQFIIDSIKK